MSHYDDALTLRDARALYFAGAGFDESSYSDPWVHLKAGPVRFAFPNTASRVRAVRLHDLHHVVTGYDTSWTGEGEIGAWEVASGCADHYAAWLLNLYAMAIGLVIAPRATFRAFVRGRRSRNFYREEFRDALLAESVGGTRRRLGLDGEVGPPPSTAERFSFAAWSLTAGASFLATLAPGAALVTLAIRALL